MRHHRLPSLPFIPQEIKAEFTVEGFFLLHSFRIKGVAEQSAQQAFDLHRGNWEITTYPNSPRAIGFWRKVLGMNGSGEYSERQGQHAHGEKVIFNFDNRESKAA